MTIHLSPELLGPLIIAVVGAFVTAIGAIVWLVRTIRTGSQANSSMADTVVTVNAALRANVEKMHAFENEQAALYDQLSTLATEGKLKTAELSQVRAKMAQLEEDQKRAIDQLGQELVKVKKELAEARQEAQTMKSSITELTAALRAAQDRVKELETREAELRLNLESAKRQIAELQRDNMTKDNDLKALQNRVRDLETELKKTQDERTALEKANADLLKRLAAIEAPDRTEPEAIETHDESPDVATSDKEQI